MGLLLMKFLMGYCDNHTCINVTFCFIFCRNNNSGGGGDSCYFFIILHSWSIIHNLLQNCIGFLKMAWSRFNYIAIYYFHDNTNNVNVLTFCRKWVIIASLPIFILLPTSSIVLSVSNKYNENQTKNACITTIAYVVGVLYCR